MSWFRSICARAGAESHRRRTEEAADDTRRLRDNRDFALLWIGLATLTVGTGISATAYPLLVWALTGSAADAGVVGFLGTLPYLLFQLPAGAVVDRFNRKRLMVVCDAGRAPEQQRVQRHRRHRDDDRQVISASHQPWASMSQFDGGEKTKLAKPPTSVTAVSACRRRWRNHLVTTVNAAS